LSLPAGEPLGVERMVGRLRAEVAKEWAGIVGATFPLKLSAAVLRPPLESGLGAIEALQQCESKLAPWAEPGVPAAPAPAASAPAPLATRQAAPAGSALRIDPLLEQIERGNPQPAIAGMPLVLRRLLPLLRLLNATQRDGLIRFLQQLRP